MKSKNSLKKTLISIIWLPYPYIRPILGPVGVCLYPIPCSMYARETMEDRPIYVAIPLIIVRLLSCNPLTALIRRLR